MNVKYSGTLVVMVLTVVSLGCQAPESEVEPESTPETSVQAAEVVAQTFNGTGMVRNITPSHTFIIIEHEAIDGFMGAMTMPFGLRDDSLVQFISVGDSVDFELLFTDEGTFITSIVVAR